MTDSINVVVASRGRPRQAYEMFTTFERTRTSGDTNIIIGVDYDEPRLREYRRWMPDYVVSVPQEHSGSYQKVTNYLALTYPARIIGSVGDDHRFRTPFWDTSVASALDGQTGITYANDLFQGKNLPTACFVSGEVVERLGWMANPYCDHLYIDNTWRDIGMALGSFIYLPDTIIEHMHYAAGKSNFDASYAKTNHIMQMEKDRAAYEKWKRTLMAEDIRKITG